MGIFSKPKAPKKPHIQKDTAASTSFFKGLYGLCEGEIYGLADGGKSIRLDGTPLINANGEPNFGGVSWEFRAGTLDQTHISGFPAVENEHNIGVELRHDRAWTKQLTNIQLSAVRVRLAWSSLRHQHDNGDITGYRIDYAVDVQTDGGSFVQVLNTSINDKTSQGYKRSHRIELPPAKKSWVVRVRRLTPNRDSEMIGDTMTVDALTEIIDAKLRYPCTALLGLQYDAQIFSNIAKVAVRLKGKFIKVPGNYNPETRQYTGLWDGTFKLAYSNNPAWVYYDLCTHKRYGLGERLAGLVDKWQLYTLAQYCDELVDDGKGGKEPRFTINVYLQKAQDAYTVLQNVASIFRAMSYWNGERIVVDSDVPKEAVYTFSRANVVSGEFIYAGTRTKERHSVIQVGWDNPDNDYKTEYEFIKDERAIAKYGIRMLQINAFGCTSQGQAQRAGQWALLSEQLETRTVSFRTGLQGFIPQVGQIINIADDIFAGRAISGRVLSITSAGNKQHITLDRTTGKVGDTLMVAGKDGAPQKAVISAVNDKVLTIAQVLDIDVGAIWAIISYDLRLMQFRVLSIKQNDDTTFDISALQYERAKFGAADTGVRTVQPYSVLKPEAIQAPNRVVITATSKVVQGISVTTLNIAWTQVKGAVAYVVRWRKDDSGWINLPKVSGQSVDIDGVYAGNYIASVQAVDGFDNESLATYSSLTKIAGKIGRPPKLARFIVQGRLFGMYLSWVFNKGSADTAYTEVEVSPDGRANIAVLGQFAYPTNSHTINGLQGNLTQYYRARIVDKLGNTSEWTNWVSATTDAQADKVLDLLQGQIRQSHLDQSLRTPIAKIGGIESGLNGIKTQIPSLQSAISTINGQLPTLNNKIATAERHLQTAQNTLNTAVANISTERNRITSAIRDISVLRSANTAKTQEIANLVQTVNGHTSSIRELGVTTGELNQKYSQLKTVADKATSDITQIKQTQNGQATSIERLGAKFDGISVGGRNYAEDGDFSRGMWASSKHPNSDATFSKENGVLSVHGTNKHWKQWQIFSKEGIRANMTNSSSALALLQDGETYTLSVEARSDSDIGGFINLKIADDRVAGSTPVRIDNLIRNNIAVTTQWKRYHVTGMLTKTAEHNAWRIMLEAHNATSPVYFRKVKLELGNQPTDYTPAPEDVQSQLNTKASTASLDEFKSAQATKEQATAQRIAALDAAYKLADTTLTARLAREEDARTSANAALTQRLDSLTADYNDNKSSITSQLKTLSDKDKSTASQISQITANVTNAQNKADTADAKATQAKADITAEQQARADADSSLARQMSALDSKFTTADNAIKASVAQAQQTASNAQQAVATAQSQMNAKFDNLVVGGRNYLSDSENLTDNKLWLWGKSSDETLGKATQTVGMLSLRGRVNGKWKQWSQIAKVRSQAASFKASETLAKMEIGKTYTVSFEAKAANTTDSLRVDFREYYAHDGDKLKNHLSKTWQITNDWVRYHATFVFNPIDINGAVPKHWALMFVYFGTSEIFIRKPKIELGNTSTDWTPAPEDADATIGAAQASLDDFKSAQASQNEATAQRIAALDAAYKQADSQANARITREEQTRASANEALTQRLDSLQSEFNGNKASIDNQLHTLSEKDKAQAQKLSQLESSLGTKATAAALNQTNTKLSQVEGRINAEVSKYNTLQTTVNNHTASIQQHSQSINGLRAQWTVKVESGGIVSGIGLASENGSSVFAIRANKFYVADPTGTAKRPMFAVLTSSTTINGVTVPAGTYISSAYIQNGSITSAKIANAAIDAAKIKDATITSAKIADAAITKAKIGHAQVDTLQIKDGAIIVPRMQYNQGIRTFYQSNEIEIGRITIDAKGGNVMINFGFQRLFSVPNGAYTWGVFVPAVQETSFNDFVRRHVNDNYYNQVGNVSFHLRRNGSDIHHVFFRPNYAKNETTAVSWLNINRDTPILLYDQYSSPSVLDSPPDGNVTYTMVMVVFSSDRHWNDDRNIERHTKLKGFSFSVFGVKR